MKKQLSDNEKIEVVKQYLTGATIKQLSFKFDRAESSIRDLIKRRGIKLRPLTEINKKFKIDEHFFDEIDTEVKAYFLGFLFADGNVKKKVNVTVLALKASDSEILEKLNKLLYKDKPLFSSSDKRVGNREDTKGIRICNKNIKDKLIKHGCHPNKTFTLEFPQYLNKKLYGSFIRGYFDGDGYIGLIRDSSILKNGEQTMSHYYKFTLTGNNSFLRSIANIFKEELNVNSSFEIRHKLRNNGIVTLTVKGRNQITKLFDYLYKNHSGFVLRRKYELFKTIKNG